MCYSLHKIMGAPIRSNKIMDLLIIVIFPVTTFSSTYTVRDGSFFLAYSYIKGSLKPNRLSSEKMDSFLMILH
jgi:hypothetical protein